MRVVLDTNILFSGIAHPRGTPGRIVSAWQQGRFELVLSEALIAEFERVMAYPKICKLLARGGLQEVELRDYVDILRMKAVVVATQGVAVPVVPRDAKDVPLIAALVASGAEFLVTSDKKDLLSLKDRRIVSAAEFVSRLEAFRTRD